MTEELSLRARYRQEHAGTPAPRVEEQIAVPTRTAALLLVDVYEREGRHAEIVRDAIAPAAEAAHSAGVALSTSTNQLAAATTPASQWRDSGSHPGRRRARAWKEPTEAFAISPRSNRA